MNPLNYLKKDDDITITLLSPHMMEISSNVPSVFIPESLEPAKEVEPDLLTQESRAQLAKIPVQIIRLVFLGHAIFSALIMTMSYLIYYWLSYDYDASVFVIAGSIVCTALFYVALMAIVSVPRLGGADSPWALPIYFGFCMSLVVFAGALASIVKNIAPLQAGTISFAQCIVVYGYTLNNPRGIEPFHCALYMVLTALFVWFIGLYGFIVQQAWISSGFLFLYGIFSSAYLALEIHQASRFTVSETDKRLALFQLYLDPALHLIDLVRKLRR
jgi:hypothetical protein